MRISIVVECPSTRGRSAPVAKIADFMSALRQDGYRSSMQMEPAAQERRVGTQLAEDRRQLSLPF